MWILWFKRVTKLIDCNKYILLWCVKSCKTLPILVILWRPIKSSKNCWVEVQNNTFDVEFVWWTIDDSFWCSFESSFWKSIAWLICEHLILKIFDIEGVIHNKVLIERFKLWLCLDVFEIDEIFLSGAFAEMLVEVLLTCNHCNHW